MNAFAPVCRSAVFILAVTCSLFRVPAAAEEELVLNAVVATVDGEPFTLQDISKRLSPPRKLTLAEAAVDAEAREVLDQLILEKLIEEEAKTRRIVVSDEEVESYVNQLAARNQLTRAEFEKALLEQQRKDIASFKKDISSQILKSKLAGELVRGGLAVSDDEVQAYITEHPELGRTGGKIKLSQILITTSQHGEGEAEKLIGSIRNKIKEGEDFAALARKYSESPEASQGGSLGLIDEKDLDPQIFETVFSLPAGQTSEVVRSAIGFHLFRVDDRMGAEKGGDETKVREEVMQILKQQKLELKLRNYFSTDLYNNHSVDKKI